MNLSPLKPVLLSLLLFWQSSPYPGAPTQHLRYERALRLPGSVTSAAGQACAVLDADVFAHAAPSLRDLRLYAGKIEVPYAITVSEPLQQESEDARVLNLDTNPGTRSGRIVFDLAMPRRPYTGVDLGLAAQDFIAIAEVSGSDLLAARNRTRLGTFTLFDLTSQHLARSTILKLPESSFPYLHIELAMTSEPGAKTAEFNRSDIVHSATVPPSREAQTVHTDVLRASGMSQRGRQSVATFRVPIHVPIERISFLLAPDFKGNFSRNVTITARVTPSSKSDVAGDSESSSGDEFTPVNESITGSIFRVHKVEAGHAISDENLSIPVAIGSNMQRPATLEVAIDNDGDAVPLPIASVRLEMRERRICFDAFNVTNPPVNLFYGDPTLQAPVYDFAKHFQPAATAVAAQIGPELPNPNFIAQSESHPLTRRHPELLWIALLGAVCISALAAIHYARRSPR